jgi:branched-subunit amino acid transport protein
MSAWLVIVAVGAGSFLFRAAPLLVLQRAKLSPSVDRSIRHAGLAAIAALIATSARHAAHGSSVAPALLAVAAGVVLGARRASMLRITLVGGGLYAAALAVVTVVSR